MELAAKAFGENQNAFLAATAFVGWRLMTNAIQEENGKQDVTSEGSKYIYQKMCIMKYNISFFLETRLRIVSLHFSPLCHSPT